MNNPSQFAKNWEFAESRGWEQRRTDNDCGQDSSIHIYDPCGEYVGEIEDGVIPDFLNHKCPDCNGWGCLPPRDSEPYGDPEWDGHHHDCPMCKGRGHNDPKIQNCAHY